MEDTLYQEIILDHAAAPRNAGRLADPTLSASDANASCGDRLTLDIRMGKGGRVEAVGIEGSGCAISQASSSLLGEALKGMTREQLAGVDDAKVRELLGIPIGIGRLRCAMLPLRTLHRCLEGAGIVPPSVRDHELPQA